MVNLTQYCVYIFYVKMWNFCWFRFWSLIRPMCNRHGNSVYSV